MPSPTRSLLRALRWLLAAAIAIGVGMLLWGDRLLIASDPLPEHVDAAVVLQGSIAAEKARIAGAVNLLQGGVADRILLSVPKESYWGQSIPPVARAYLAQNYGSDIAARIDFCETGAEVNSTKQEAQVSGQCIQEHHWRSIAIVTSDYHTRRAGMLWKGINRNDPGLHLWIVGVADPEFRQPWWRHRQSAKVWVMETAKLAWTMIGG
jgi:uncharacterized SAM-binding protein YcdF (DUF218 family)